MKRVLAAAALLLLLGTALVPQAQARDLSTGRSSIALLGPRSDYHTSASLLAELQALVSSHPEMLRMESIGKTYEGRDIWAVKLSDDVNTNDSAEPDVLIFGGIHAREIMGPEVVLHVLNYMVDGYGKNETLTKYVNTKETWFVPTANPDGYAYVRDQGQDWRKNRRPTTGGNIGIDLNRNWGYMFGTDGSTSPDPASEVYHGPYPFSENETIALRDLALRQRFATALSFHSHGQLILYPWGYTSAQAPDHDELASMAAAMAAWNGYTDEQSSSLYATHGSSEDWFYANTSTRAFTFELDTNFYPPASQIDVTCPLNREPTLYLIGYPNVSIDDAGIISIVSPYNGTVVEPDRPLNVTVKVMNCGSGEEDIPVEMVISGGNYSYRNNTSVQLRAGQVGQAGFSWDPPLIGAENYTLEVRTNLTGDSAAWNDRAGARFRIRAKYGCALNATGNTTASCFPGESASFELKLTSLGNREDDFIFEASGNPIGWAVAPSTVHLPPAGTTNVALVVSVPRNAAPGLSASISLRAQSATGMGSAGVVSTTTKVLDPAPTAAAGNDVAVDVTQQVQFDGSASYAPNGSLTGYFWDFGDGNTSEGVKASHAYARRGTYFVNLTVTSDRGWNDTDQLVVTVNQAFRVDISVEKPSLKVLPGADVTMNFTVKNGGNGPDSVSLALEALKWNASLDVQNISLAFGGARNVRLSFSVPVDALAGTVAFFRVRAQSTESAYAKADTMLTATVDEVHSLDFNISPTHRSADAGGSPFFQATVRNNGNIAENLTLAATDVPDGWTVRFSQENLSIPAWNTTTLRITADVPSGELAGDYSFSVRGIGLTVSVNERRAVEARVDVQSLQVKPRGTAVFNLTVTNKGNAPVNLEVRRGALPAGWDRLNLTPPVIIPLTLQPGSNSTTRLTFPIPANAKAGVYSIPITVVAPVDANVSVFVPLTVEVLKVQAPPVTSSTGLSGMFLPLLVVIVIVVVVAAVAVAYSGRKKKTAPADAMSAPVSAPASAVEAIPATSVPSGVPAARTPPAAPPEEEPLPCIWCFKRIREGERTIKCAGCGAQLHPDCALAAGTCPRCGWKI